MKIGQTINGKVVRSGSWGVYFRTANGDLGFVDALELSWSPSVTDSSIPGVGDNIEGVVTRVFLEPQTQGHSFVASVRALSPSDDPWSEENRYAPGQIVSGTVTLVGDGFAVIKLQSGATAALHPSPVGLKMGESVEVKIVAVDLVTKTIAVQLPELPSSATIP